MWFGDYSDNTDLSLSTALQWMRARYKLRDMVPVRTCGIFTPSDSFAGIK